jgi:hypothetical protein
MMRLSVAPAYQYQRHNTGSKPLVASNANTVMASYSQTNTPYSNQQTRNGANHKNPITFILATLVSLITTTVAHAETKLQPTPPNTSNINTLQYWEQQSRKLEQNHQRMRKMEQGIQRRLRKIGQLTNPNQFPKLPTNTTTQPQGTTNKR